MAEYLVGIDIGGTFTDCVVVDAGGNVTTAKAPSTPPDFSRGMFEALESAAERLGLKLGALAKQLALVSHGTTIGTNALITKRGATVGLITTRGHEDCIHIMRGSRGYGGRDIRKVVHFSEGRKPDPIVPRRLIAGVSERVDCFGKVVVELNLAEAEAAVDRLLAEGAKAIAICFLWSFKNPEHERGVKAIVQQRAPGMFVTCSSELVPKWGEYERTTATVLNAYVGPVTASYLKNIDERLQALGYRAPLQITQCAGGTISVAKAVEAPLLTLDSGPVSGVTGSMYLAELMGEKNVITTDMGGTSFDVGIIYHGEAARSHLSTVNQYEYFLPKVDIQAIGAGGGSLAWIDEITGTLHVGPDSAGALPGPICYRRGGTVPTVTDADLLLGYLDPDTFAGGKISLDLAAAAKAIDAMARKLGLSPDETAAGIAKIAEFNMADLIRRATIEKGFDPRDFVLFAFGGAGPMHAGIFARELGIRKVVVPQRKTASTWCAFGAAAADILHVYEKVDIMRSPFSAEAMNSAWRGLREHAAAQLARDGMKTGRYALFVDIRHRGQINEVEVPIVGDGLDDASIEQLAIDFFDRYEQLYGRGSSFRGARLEAVTFRCRATASTPNPQLMVAAKLTESLAPESLRPQRAVYWADPKRRLDTPVYNGDRLVAGNRIGGPAIVETLDTTVVVHPGQTLSVDKFGNFALDTGA